KLTFTTVTAEQRPLLRPDVAAAAAKALLAVAALLGAGAEVDWSNEQSFTDTWWLRDAVRTLTGLVRPPPDGLGPWVAVVLDLLRMDLAVGGTRPTDQTPSGWLGARLDELDRMLDLVIAGALDAAEITRRLDTAERLLTEVPEEERAPLRVRMQTIRSVAALGTHAHEAVSAMPWGWRLSGPMRACLEGSADVRTAAGVLGATVRARFEQTIRRAMVDHGDAVLKNYPKLSPVTQTWVAVLQVNNIRSNLLPLLAAGLV